MALLVLRYEGKLLLEAVCNYLKKQGITFIAVVEVYNGRNKRFLKTNFFPHWKDDKEDEFGFHVHGLCIGKIDFSNWINEQDCNREDLYCSKIYENSSQSYCIRYLEKDFEETKEELVKLGYKCPRVYKKSSGFKVIKKEKEHFFVSKEELEEILRENKKDFVKVNDSSSNSEINSRLTVREIAENSDLTNNSCFYKEKEVKSLTPGFNHWKMACKFQVMTCNSNSSFYQNCNKNEKNWRMGRANLQKINCVMKNIIKSHCINVCNRKKQYYFYKIRHKKQSKHKK